VFDFSSFRKAIGSLEEILALEPDEYIRDGAIQRFEYTFELAWKSMQRLLKEEGVRAGSPKQTFRAAMEAGIIESVEPWFEFLKARNLTVHTYNADMADEVYETAKALPPLARKLLEVLEERA
jgi:nucleotidyltransferase substrate binding protein (TIGR01987 family)